MEYRETKKVTITFYFEEKTDTSLPDAERAMEDLYEHLEKLDIEKVRDNYDLIEGHRSTNYAIKYY